MHCRVVMSSEGGVVGSVVPDVSKPPCVFILWPRQLLALLNRKQEGGTIFRNVWTYSPIAQPRVYHPYRRNRRPHRAPLAPNFTGSIKFKTQKFCKICGASPAVFAGRAVAKKWDETALGVEGGLAECLLRLGWQLLSASLWPPLNTASHRGRYKFSVTPVCWARNVETCGAGLVCCTRPGSWRGMEQAKSRQLERHGTG